MVISEMIVTLQRFAYTFGDIYCAIRCADCGNMHEINVDDIYRDLIRRVGNDIQPDIDVPVVVFGAEP